MTTGEVRSYQSRPKGEPAVGHYTQALHSLLVFKQNSWELPVNAGPRAGRVGQDHRGGLRLHAVQEGRKILLGIIQLALFIKCEIQACCSCRGSCATTTRAGTCSAAPSTRSRSEAEGADQEKYLLAYFYQIVNFRTYVDVNCSIFVCRQNTSSLFIRFKFFLLNKILREFL